MNIYLDLLEVAIRNSSRLDLIFQSDITSLVNMQCRAADDNGRTLDVDSTDDSAVLKMLILYMYSVFEGRDGLVAEGPYALIESALRSHITATTISIATALIRQRVSIPEEEALVLDKDLAVVGLLTGVVSIEQFVADSARVGSWILSTTFDPFFLVSGAVLKLE